MKKKISLFLSVPVFFLLSCEGPKGDPGEPGINILGSVFEIEIDFNEGNGFASLFQFPSSIQVFDSDIVLVYIQTGVDGGAPVWEMLPDSVFFTDSNEILVYDFDYTSSDVVIFLNGNVEFATLDASWTQNQLFRIAVVPADFAKTPGIDLANLNQVMNALQVKNVERIEIGN